MGVTEACADTCDPRGFCFGFGAQLMIDRQRNQFSARAPRPIISETEQRDRVATARDGNRNRSRIVGAKSLDQSVKISAEPHLA